MFGSGADELDVTDEGSALENGIDAAVVACGRPPTPCLEDDAEGEAVSVGLVELEVAELGESVFATVVVGTDEAVASSAVDDDQRIVEREEVGAVVELLDTTVLDELGGSVGNSTGHIAVSSKIPSETWRIRLRVLTEYVVLSASRSERPRGMVACPIIVADPRDVRRRVVRVDGALRAFRTGDRIVLAEDRILRCSDGGGVGRRSGHRAVERGHVEVCCPVVREPKPAADALLARTGWHSSRYFEIRHLLLNAFVLDTEDREVVHSDFADIVDVGDGECATGDEVVIDDFAFWVASLRAKTVSKAAWARNRLPGLCNRYGEPTDMIRSCI